MGWGDLWETYDEEKLKSPPGQRNVLWMMLRQYIEHVTVVDQSGRENSQPFASLRRRLGVVGPLRIHQGVLNIAHGIMVPLHANPHSLAFVVRQLGRKHGLGTFECFVNNVDGIAFERKS